LKETLGEQKLAGKITVIISNAGSNIKVETKLLGVTHLPYLAHLLSFVVNDATAVNK
jgi:hypothetical protein